MSEFIKKYSNFVRPKVLIIGNGLVRNSKNKTWYELIKSLSADEYKELELPKATPYSIRATVLTDDEDVTRHNKYENEFMAGNYAYEYNTCLSKLLRIPFDAILTTNYTYEIEYQMKSNYPELSNKTKRNYSFNTYNNSSDAKYLIRTFNRLKTDEYGEKDIWHIHGEQRRKSSMILTHDEYIKLINKEVDYFSKRNNEYEENQNEIYFKSWLDYFVLGELYIIGLGFDFSEFDLWWLLNRRIRENINKNNIPHIHFFDPLHKWDENEEAHNSDVSIVLNEMKVNIYDLNVTVDDYLGGSSDADSEKLNTQYREFYKKAIEKINELMGGKLNGNFKM